MVNDRNDFIVRLINDMTVEQKVGQCLVIGFTGTILTPKIIERINKFSPAGIRMGLTFRCKTATHDPYASGEENINDIYRLPNGTIKDYLPDIPVPHCTNSEYCGLINTLKKAALNNDVGIPLHVAFDMEGDLSADYFHGGIKFFPSQMGIASTQDIELAYRVAWATARQLVPLGVDWIHSPILDINTNPLNPEIGTRSYSDRADVAIRFAKEAVKGFTKGGLISTGKHFPGRGESVADSHSTLPVIDLNRKEMDKHISVFADLIYSGIPAIMSAHTAYPCLDKSGLPASLSKTIITDLLKKEIGFKGSVTTDDLLMGGIVSIFSPAEACEKAINAGNDLLLFRDEGAIIDEVYDSLVDAVKNNRISESRLNDAIYRTLSVKHKFGFFDQPNRLRDVAKADIGINDKIVSDIARESSQRSISVIRDRNKVLPLSKRYRIMLVEQVNPLHERVNSMKCHPGILWENMLKHSSNVSMVEVNVLPTQSDIERVEARLDEADVIVATNYYDRRVKIDNKLLDMLTKLNKPLIVVTNSPFPSTVSNEYDTVIVTFGSSPESIEALSDIIFEYKNHVTVESEDKEMLDTLEKIS